MRRCCELWRGESINRGVLATNKIEHHLYIIKNYNKAWYSTIWFEMMWRWTIIKTEIQTRTKKGTRTKIHSLKMLISACLVNTVTRVSLSHLRLIVFFPCTQEPSMTYVLDFYYSYFFTFTAIILVTPNFLEPLLSWLTLW